MDERRMTLVEHLAELRRVLIVAGLGWLAATTAAFVFNRLLLGLVERPLRSVLSGSNHITDKAIFLSPTEGLTIPLKISAVAGLVLAFPVIAWQAWTFVAPGLRPAERRFAGPFVLTAVALFVAGGAFAYFVMPIGLGFLAGFLSGNAIYFPDLNAYLSFFLLLVVVFGITFELPVVVILLGLLGLTTSSWLRQRRRVVWLAIIITAMLVTPGADPFTPTALFIPLIGLFEASLLVLDKVLHK